MRVLLIEDDSDLKELMTVVLEEEGYAVDAYGDCETALKKYKYNYYNILITDNFLPGMKGVEFIEKLHNLDPRLKSIIVSVGNIAQDKNYLKSIGVIKVFQKPFNLNELVALLEGK